MPPSIPAERIRTLNSSGHNEEGDYVLYAMQSAQRTQDNPALALAVERANARALPLVVAFCLIRDFPDATLRHYSFMLEGLAVTFQGLRKLGALPVLVEGDWASEMQRLSKRASEVVLDQGYLRLHKANYARLAETVDCRLFQVEGEAVVPVEVASEKVEYAARTIRPRIHRHLADFLHRVKVGRAETSASKLSIDSLDKGLANLPKFLKSFKIDESVAPVPQFFAGGPEAAEAQLANFLEAKLGKYDEMRNQPQTDYTSNMSPYLHYGMISPVHVALSVTEQLRKGDPQAESYVEELVVRRGLSQNFCHFTDNYDEWDCLPEWARRTLTEHKNDPRHGYSRSQLENAETHDLYWNAAQVEMVETGYMHNYMRMYWGKKILEWSSSPKHAYETTLYINNRYFLDGRDPVSFANVAWIYGLHDRAWQERPVFGKIRCMMASGLERKNDPKAYVEKVEKMTGRKVKGQAAKEQAKS